MKTINEKIAERLGWRWVAQGKNIGYWELEVKAAPVRTVMTSANCPQYDTDRNASAEILQWFAAQTGEALWSHFTGYLIDAYVPIDQQAYATWGDITKAVLLATPRQICDAACKVWGIE